MMHKSELWKTQTRIHRAQAAKDFDAALAEIQRLTSDESPDIRMTGLFHRGEIRELQGAFEEALSDWEEALRLPEGSAFLRYELYRKLAASYERSGNIDTALGALRFAMQVCSEDDKFSGNLALADFMRLCNGKIAIADRPLVKSVVIISWRVLEVPDTPNLTTVQNKNLAR
jgi:tetratricopeptide (TPR) repeat protein